MVVLYCGYATALFFVLASIHLRKGKGGWWQWWWDGVGDVAPFSRNASSSGLESFFPSCVFPFSSSLYPLSLIPAFHAGTEAEKKSSELGTGDFHLWRCVVVARKDSRLLTSERFILEEVGGEKRRVHEDFSHYILHGRRGGRRRGTRKSFPQLIALGGKKQGGLIRRLFKDATNL